MRGRVFPPMPVNLTAGALLTVLLAGMALVSLVWTPYPPDAMRIAIRLQPPSAAHWLGTDHFGRDILSMIMVGARNSLAVGAVAVGTGMAVGVPLGLAAASFGGWIDEAVGRLTDLPTKLTGRNQLFYSATSTARRESSSWPGSRWSSCRNNAAASIAIPPTHRNVS